MAQKRVFPRVDGSVEIVDAPFPIRSLVMVNPTSASLVARADDGSIYFAPPRVISTWSVNATLTLRVSTSAAIAGVTGDTAPYVLVSDAPGQNSTAQLATLSGASKVIPYCRLRTSVPQACPNFGVAILAWDLEDADTDAMHDAGTPARIVFKTAGIYVVSATIAWQSNVTGARSVFFGSNLGFRAGVRVPANPVGGEASLINATDIFHVSAGDWVDARVYQGSGGALNVVQSDGGLGPPTAFEAAFLGTVA